jgi:hypothetical protein
MKEKGIKIKNHLSRQGAENAPRTKGAEDRKEKVIKVS